MTLETSQNIMTMMMAKSVPEIAAAAAATTPLTIEIPEDDNAEFIVDDASVEDLEQASEPIVEESFEQNVTLEVHEQTA